MTASTDDWSWSAGPALPGKGGPNDDLIYAATLDGVVARVGGKWKRVAEASAGGACTAPVPTRIRRGRYRHVALRRPRVEVREAADQAPEQVTTRERYPRRARLTRGPEVEACWREGRRIRTAHLDLAWRTNSYARPRAAIIVPRYQFTAVARNRLRRRLREILRRGVLAACPPVDLVVRAKRVAYQAPFATLRDELSAAVTEAG